MKMKMGPVAQFLLIGFAVGVIAPFFLSLCLFGTTLQMFMQAPAPTPGFWSGAPTAGPTPVPSQVQKVGSAALGRQGGAVFVLWSILGALAGEAVGSRWPGGDPMHQTRREVIGAVLGAVIFSLVALFLFLPQGPAS